MEPWKASPRGLIRPGIIQVAESSLPGNLEVCFACVIVDLIGNRG